MADETGQTTADRLALLKETLLGWLKRIEAGDIIEVDLFTSRAGKFPLPATPPDIGNPMAPSGDLTLLVFARSRGLSEAAVAAVEQRGKAHGGLVVPPVGAALRDLRN